MSAFVVSSNHIFSLLKSLEQFSRPGQVVSTDRGTYNPNTLNDQGKMAQILYEENVRSYNHRYNNEGEAGLIPFATGAVLTPVETIKSCDCYIYQSCETEDYYKSEAHEIITEIREAAITKLPGYDEAPWGIE